MIPYGKQDISQADIDAVVDVLKSDFLTQGPQVPLFEKTVANYCGVDFGVAVNSATSALHIACLALDLGKGDYLWTSPNTFVASANCGLYCDAKVDFVDINPHTYNLCANKLEEKLKQAKLTNQLPKIVIPVHFAGQSCEMKRIYELSLEYGFKIIEDASHAIGGKYLGKPIGGCQYSDITVFSFHPVKIITTGEGGIATTNQPGLAKKMQLLRSHGVTRDSDLMTKELEGEWYYQQVDLGFNYRMTEMQAALGVSQFDNLKLFVEKRHELAKKYDSLLENIPVTRPHQAADAYSSFHLYPITLNKGSEHRKQVFDKLRGSGVGANIHYIPVHTQPYYQKIGFKLGDFPVAESYYKKSITLPLHPGISNDDLFYITDVLKDTLK